MSDTVIFGRVRVPGHLKAILLYTSLSIIISTCVGLGQAFFDMEQDKWSAMWWMKRLGWWLLQVGNIAGNAFNTFKAAVSNSTRPPVEKTN